MWVKKTHHDFKARVRILNEIFLLVQSFILFKKSVFLKLKIIKLNRKSRLSIKDLALQAKLQGKSFTGAAATWRRKFLFGGHLPINLTRLEHFNQSRLFPTATNAGDLI